VELAEHKLFKSFQRFKTFKSFGKSKTNATNIQRLFQVLFLCFYCVVVPIGVSAQTTVRIAFNGFGGVDLQEAELKSGADIHSRRLSILAGSHR
jgi:hypothetical protein